MSDVSPEPREQVGPYRVLRAIGSGGSSRIDLARLDRPYDFQRHVVLKRPLDHFRGDPVVTASLRREARLGARLRHPNLVAVLDAGEHDGYDYLVLEYVQGASLRSLMQAESADRVRDVPLAVAIGIAADVARALNEAHELLADDGTPLGLVHCDVSPNNVLLGVDGAVKLADFGIAKETRITTLSGSMRGTVTYMAPERCLGHAFDRRADIFSIGVFLYELVTGTRLFWADNEVASLHKVISGQIVPPRQLVPALPSALEEIVMSAVAHAPGDRFSSARELVDALEQFAGRKGLVIGARVLARTLEEVIGARPAPWIAATTVVDPIPAPSTESLISLIEAADKTEEPAPAPMKPRRRRIMWWAFAAAAALVIGLLAAIPRARNTTPEPAPVIAPLEQAPTPTVTHPVPERSASAAPPPAIPEPSPEVAVPPPKPTKTRVHATERRTVVVDHPAPAPAPQQSPPRSPPTRVEWNPGVLLLPDAGDPRR